MTVITVLRIGHRRDRDKRITTHVALVARAFGVNKIIVSTKDKVLETTVNAVTARFGGQFVIETGKSWKTEIEHFKGIIVHLTMYGMPLDSVISDIPKNTDLMIIVGSEKVPAEVYKKAHFNVAITNQPHSEVAALAIFLDHYFKGRELYQHFNGRYRVVPTEHGKTMKIYTRAESIKLLNKLNAPKAIIEQSKAVADFALKIAVLCNADVNLVEMGAMLHNIGKIVSNTSDHALVGAKILRDLHYPDELSNIVERHSALLNTKMPMPQTLEEKIVAYATSVVEEHVDKVQALNKEYFNRVYRELSTIAGVDLYTLILEKTSKS